MAAEARPIIEHMGLTERQGVFAPLPCRLYEGKVRETKISVVINGREHDRDLIGCEPAAVTTLKAIETLHPDIVISMGTCGAWQRKGASVGEVYIANGAMFHDRRVPGDNAWHTQGLGNYPLWEGSEALAKELHLPMGKVTTGSSFDLTPEDERMIDENGGELKEMEGAAVAFVCHLTGVPCMLVKAVTNLRDVKEDENMDTFHDNLRQATERLATVNEQIIEILTRQ
jgi:nucleoside phosphorylase